MSSALAAVGRIRKRLGVDEGERCNSRNIVQPHLSCVQGMEELDRPWSVLRPNGFGPANDDLDHRA
jgi:hypothetical protein